MVSKEKIQVFGQTDVRNDILCRKDIFVIQIYFLNPHKIFISTSNLTIVGLKHALKPENLKYMYILSISNRSMVSIEKIQKVFGQTDVRNDIHQIFFSDAFFFFNSVLIQI